MRTIRFTPTEADTLDAQRAFYWKRMISRRHLMGYAVLWAIATGVVAGALFAVAPPATPALFAVALMVGLLLVALIPWLTFASLPRVVKRTYAQQVMLRVRIHGHLVRSRHRGDHAANRCPPRLDRFHLLGRRTADPDAVPVRRSLQLRSEIGLHRRRPRRHPRQPCRRRGPIRTVIGHIAAAALR